MNEQETIEQLRAQGYEVNAPSPGNIPWFQEVAALEKRLDRIERRSGLMSKSWFTRAFTAWVYILTFQLMLAVVFLLIAGLFGLLGS